MLTATWKTSIEDRAKRLQAELDLVLAQNAAASNHPDFVAAAKAINYARGLAGLPKIDYLPGDSGAGPSWWQRPVARLTGASIEAAWLALHRADEALLMLQPPETVRSRAVEMLADVSALIPASDPRAPIYREILQPLTAGKLGVPEPAALTAAPASPPAGGPTVPTGDVRTALRSMRATLNASSDTAFGNLRSYRNVLAAVMLVLIVCCAGVIWAAWQDPAGWNLCGPGSAAGTSQQCLDGSTNPRSLDLAEVAIAAALGALVSAVVGMLKLQGFRGPYSLPLVQALLKIPMGAAVGLVAILLLQRGIFGVLAPVPGIRVLAYAALFGFAQLAVTTLIDNQANDIIQKARSKDDPGKRSQAGGQGGVNKPAGH